MSERHGYCAGDHAPCRFATVGTMSAVERIAFGAGAAVVAGLVVLAAPAVVELVDVAAPPAPLSTEANTTARESPPAASPTRAPSPAAERPAASAETEHAFASAMSEFPVPLPKGYSWPPISTISTLGDPASFVWDAWIAATASAARAGDTDAARALSVQHLPFTGAFGQEISGLIGRGDYSTLLLMFPLPLGMTHEQ